MRNVALVALMLINSALGPAATATSQPATTRAASPHEPPVIHQIKAGTPGRDGWYAAESTSGKFVVATPAPFNDITVSHVEPDGSRVSTHMIAATGIGVSCIATASSNSSVKLPANAAELYLDMLATHGTAGNKHAAKLDGVDCTEVEVFFEGVITRHRVVQRDDVIYALKVEVRGREFGGGDNIVADKFFESFRFPAPEADNAPGRTASATP